MNNYSIIIFLWLGTYFTVPLIAQEISRHVFAAGGDHYTSQEISISCSFGQAGLTGTLKNENLTVTAGFQQMDGLIPTYVRDLENDISIIAFPNPFQDYFTITIESNKNGYVNYMLYDIEGKKIGHQKTFHLYKYYYKDNVYVKYLKPGIYILKIRCSLNTGNVQKYAIPLVKF